MLNAGKRATVRRRTGGFTLIEATVVMSILGLLVIAVLPGISGWMRSLRVRTAADSLQNGVQRARMEALRRNQEVSFWLVTNPTTNSCAASSSSGSWVVVLGSADPTGNCGTLLTNGGVVIERYSMPPASSSVMVGGSNGGAGSSGVAFNVFGQVKTGGTPLLKIAVTYPSASDVRELDVDITPGGLVRMCDPAVGKTDSRACPDAT